MIARDHPSSSAPTLCFGYVRVSTLGQAVEGISLDNQRERIKAWAAAHGVALAQIHEDAGLSGGRADNRPGLQSAIMEACRRKGVLVVFSLSRLARSTRDAIGIAERLEKAGVDLVSLSERIDTTSAAGRLFFRLMASLNEFERDQIAERTAAALQHLRAQGKRVGGIPYGFGLSADGKTLLAIPRELEAVALIRRLRQFGTSLRGIVKELEERGISPKRTGGKWSPKVIRDLIRRTYPWLDIDGTLNAQGTK